MAEVAYKHGATYRAENSGLENSGLELFLGERENIE